MNKTKNKDKKLKLQDEPTQNEDYPMVPPEVHFLTDRYVVRLPVSDPHFKSPWELRKYLAKLLANNLGDEVEMTSVKLKKPHLIAKARARMLKREPSACLFVTVKF